MKSFKLIALAAVSCLVAVASFAAEEKSAAKAKPYPLKVCVVTDEKFGGEMGDPYVFSYQGREVKLCCKGCLKEFNAAPAKYVKKMDAAEKKK